MSKRRSRAKKRGAKNLEQDSTAGTSSGGLAPPMALCTANNDGEDENHEKAPSIGGASAPASQQTVRPHEMAEPLKRLALSGGDNEYGPSTSKSPRLNRDDGADLGQLPEVLDTRKEVFDLVETMLNSSRLVLLKGPIGSGKTHCAKEIAKRRGIPLYVVQLNDQWDAKMLFGVFDCTDVPGEFVWSPSEFSKHLQSECLILLEDIDSTDVGLMASVVELVESRNFTQPDGRVTSMNKGCRIIATVRTMVGEQGTSQPIIGGGMVAAGNGSSLIRRDYPYWVELAPLSDQEMGAIALAHLPTTISSTHPLRSLVGKLLQIFKRINELISTKFVMKCSTERRLNVRDFLRACNRILPPLLRQQQLQPQQGSTTAIEIDAVSVFRELCDLWVMHLSLEEFRWEVAKLLGRQLNLADEAVTSLLNQNKPELCVVMGEPAGEPSQLMIGRICLTMKNREGSRPVEQLPFGLTHATRQMMERLAACVSLKEPVLLVGETGVGKTSAVQLLAAQCNIPLHVVNMSADSDYTDLIGGYKPTSIVDLIRPLASEVTQLFEATMDVGKNKNFIEHLNRCLNTHQYASYLELVTRVGTSAAKANKAPAEWARLVVRASRLADTVNAHAHRGMPFAYKEGVVAEAVRLGHWLLVDEINLAPAECLDAVMQTLQEVGETAPHPEFRLFACMNPPNDVGKRGLAANVRSKFTEFFVGEPTQLEELKVIVRCYLPSVKEDISLAIANFYMEVRRQFPANRFSLRTLCRALTQARGVLATHASGIDPVAIMCEGCRIAFSSGLNCAQRAQLASLIAQFFGQSSRGGARLVAPRSQKLREEFVEVEGSWIMRGRELIEVPDPLFIMTPTIRANLTHLAAIVAARRYPILLEGETSTGKTSTILHLAKLTGNRVHRINNHEHTDVEEYIGGYAPASSLPGEGANEGEENGCFLRFTEGPLLQAVRNGEWVILDELNLAPPAVLEALNRLLDDNREIFVPELNATVKAHPRFQLFATQNPVGSYSGRKHLSRAFLNRFLLVPSEQLPDAELASVVQARCSIAPSAATVMVEMMGDLKARRALSGLFSAADGLMTMRDLFRWGSRVHCCGEGTDWRRDVAEQGYLLLACRCRHARDERTVIEVLENRLKRKLSNAVERMFTTTSPRFPQEANQMSLDAAHGNGIMLIHSMRRMLVLCAEAWKCNEPVLLVGGTGCGKTTAAYLMAGGNELLTVNCHERTETADFLGSLRPAGGGKFRWQDGVVVEAMRAGKKLLIDEISLAPDSVLERLNSLLEPGRSLHLSSGGSGTTTSDGGEFFGGEVVVAKDGFQLIATMNPGNDHGKKELSKALRNRFTEVWCPCKHSPEEMRQILERNLQTTARMNPAANSYSLHRIERPLQRQAVEAFPQFAVRFFSFFEASFSLYLHSSPTIRDLIACAGIFQACLQPGESTEHTTSAPGISPVEAIYHSLSACLLDPLGVLPARATLPPRQRILQLFNEEFRRLAVEFGFLAHSLDFITDETYDGMGGEVEWSAGRITAGGFHVPSGSRGIEAISPPTTFHFNAPTTRRNVFRVARALACDKPVMLEGSPGAGKSSLIVALAAATGHELIRLNLSEQTDLTDLFGCDVPCVDAVSGVTTFEWRDGPVLAAIKRGAWLLLDEMNLASQSVLEGLNSCFDFRKSLRINELNKTFFIGHDDEEEGMGTTSRKCRFFACQNPQSQGGGRRALPRSFLNRFTSIFVEQMGEEDYRYVLERNYATTTSTEMWQQPQQLVQLPVQEMIAVNREVNALAIHCGGPFEFNLRDLMRWCEASRQLGSVGYAFELIYLSRLRCSSDMEKAVGVYNKVFADQLLDHAASYCYDFAATPPPLLSIRPAKESQPFASPSTLVSKCGEMRIELPLLLHSDSRMQLDELPLPPCQSSHLLLASQSRLVHKLLACVRTGVEFVLLVGEANCGKRSTVECVAAMLGHQLASIRLSPSTDAMELLGTYEQIIDTHSFEEQRLRLKDILLQLAGGVGDKTLCNSLISRVDACTNAAQLQTLVMEAQIALAGCSTSHSSALAELQQLLTPTTTTSTGGLLPKPNAGMHFEWINSSFVNAYANGGWIVVEDVNCCNSAVLDCLNSCLEAGGELTLPEQGNFSTTVKKHPEFRVFFTMDPRNGPLSRAMRNRAVELFLHHEQDYWCRNPIDFASLAVEENECMSMPGTSGTSLTDPSVVVEPTSLERNDSIMHATESGEAAVELTKLTPTQALQRIAVERRHSPSTDGDLFARNKELIRRPCISAKRSANLGTILHEYYQGCWQVSTSGVVQLLQPSLNEFFFNSLTGDCDLGQNKDEELKHRLSESIDPRIGERYHQLMELREGNAEWRACLEIFEHLRLCGPFACRQDQEEFLQRIAPGCGTNAEMEERSEGMNATLGGVRFFLHQLCHAVGIPSLRCEQTGAPSMQLLCCLLSFPSPSSSPGGLVWRSEEAKNAFSSMLALGSAATAFQLTVDEMQIDVLTALRQLPLPTMIANHIWTAVDDGGPRSTALTSFTFATHADSISKFNRLASLLWRLSFTDQRGLSNAMGAKVKQLVEAFLPSESNTTALHCALVPIQQPPVGHAGEEEVVDSTITALSHLYQLLIAMQPPSEFIDPALQTSIQLDYWCHRGKVADGCTQAIGTFFHLIGGSGDWCFEDGNGKNKPEEEAYHMGSYLARKVQHPLARALITEADLTTRNATAVAERGGFNLNCHRDGYKFFRTTPDKFPQLVISLRRLLHMLLNFLQPLLEKEEEPVHGATKKYSIAVVEMFKSRLRQINSNPTSHSSKAQSALSSFTTKLAQFLQTLRTEVENLRNAFLPHYPDILLPCLLVFNSLHIHLSTLGRMALSVVRRAELESELHLPLDAILHHFRHPESPLTNGTKLLDWALGKGSPLPINLQFHAISLHLASMVAESRSRGGPFPNAILTWILEKWGIWYEKYSEKKREQLFVYKKASSSTLRYDAGEDGEEAAELEELSRYLPEIDEEESEDQNAGEEAGLDVGNGNEVTETRVPTQSSDEQQQRVLDDNELSTLLNLFLASKGECGTDVGTSTIVKPPPSGPLYHPMLWVMRNLHLHHLTSASDESSAIRAQHLIHLHAVKENLLSHSGGGVVGLPSPQGGLAATSADSLLKLEGTELPRCVEAMRVLGARVAQLREEFPENAVLREVEQSAGLMLAAQCRQPLTKAATLLERVLVAGDDWMRLADRAHSIRDEMSPLQALLVEWRRRELLHWGGILTQMREDTAKLALLSAWPLVEALQTLRCSAAAGNEEQEKMVVLMLVDWVHRSTLVDFEERLTAGRLMSRLVISSTNSHNPTQTSTGLQHSRIVFWEERLAAKFDCVIAHFELNFSKPVSTALKKVYGGVERELQDFIRIAKYSERLGDVGSLRHSRQKAHAQLQKILRRFKRECMVPASAILLDQLPPTLTEMPSLSVELDSPRNGEGRSKLCVVVRKMDTLLSKLLDVNELAELQSMASELHDTLSSEVHYNGDDEAKQKQQGRALFERQRLFFALVRSAKRVRLIARRSQQLDSDALTTEAMTNIGPSADSHADSKELERLVRGSVAARNVFLKRFASIKSAQQEHARQQLSPEVLANLKGSVEYGLHWAVNALQALQSSLLGRVDAFGEVANGLAALLQNTEAGVISLNYMALHDAHHSIESSLGEMARTARTLAQLVRACPQSENTEHSEAQQALASDAEEFDSLAAALPASVVGPLAKLTQPSDEHSSLTEAITVVEGAIGELRALCGEFKRKEVAGVWEMRDISTFDSTCKRKLDSLLNTLLPPLQRYFSTECEQLAASCKACIEQLQKALEGRKRNSYQSVGKSLSEGKEKGVTEKEKGPGEKGEVNFSFTEPKSLLLSVQHLFEEISKLAADAESSKQSTRQQSPSSATLDGAKKLIELTSRVDLEKAYSHFAGYLRSMLTSLSTHHSPVDSGSYMDELRQAQMLCADLHQLVEALSKRLSLFLSHFAAFLIGYESVGCRLLTNGFVNPIPKDGKGGEAMREGSSREQLVGGDGDPCGFGDTDGSGGADGATDVSHQIENMEQVEGVKDAEGREGEEGGTDSSNQQHKDGGEELPIEMEEDFAAVLENVDGLEDNSEDEGDRNREENEEGQFNKDIVDWAKGGVDEPDEREELDPDIWEDEGEGGDEEKRPDEQEGEEQARNKKRTGQQTAATSAQDKNAAGTNKNNSDSEDGESHAECPPGQAESEQARTADETPMDSSKGEGKKDDIGDDEENSGDEGEVEGTEMAASPTDEQCQEPEERDHPPGEQGQGVEAEGTEKEEDELEDGPNTMEWEKSVKSSGGAGAQPDPRENQEGTDSEGGGGSRKRKLRGGNNDEATTAEDGTQSEGEGSSEEQDENAAMEEGIECDSRKNESGASIRRRGEAPYSTAQKRRARQDGSKNPPEGRVKRKRPEVGHPKDSEGQPAMVADDEADEERLEERELVEDEGADSEGENDDGEEEGNCATHIRQRDEKQLAGRERHLVHSSTVEEALATRGLFSRIHSKRPTTTEHLTEGEEYMDAQHGEEGQESESSKKGEEAPMEDGSLALAENSIVLSPEEIHSLMLIHENSDQHDVANKWQELLREKLAELSAKGVAGEKVEEKLAMKWALISESVALYSSELAENLRSIIEPTIASRLEGDYRTGKRLNMRRLIAYIASDYRKDRIWMRRSRREKRNYDICIAVDDSASMRDVLVTEVACQSLCLIMGALRQLEIGRLSICKFGSEVQLLTDFADSTTHADSSSLGAQLLSELTFQQERTDLVGLLSTMEAHFRRAREESAAMEANQMLIILGDGRGALADGVERVRSALGRLTRARVTVLYLAIDNGNTKSIEEMHVAEFTGADGATLTMTPYMRRFPFPFHAVVKGGVGALPTILSEAVRQWFQFVAG